jgi:hypothetical protein
MVRCVSCWPSNHGRWSGVSHVGPAITGSLQKDSYINLDLEPVVFPVNAISQESSSTGCSLPPERASRRHSSERGSCSHMDRAAGLLQNPLPLRISPLQISPLKPGWPGGSRRPWRPVGAPRWLRQYGRRALPSATWRLWRDPSAAAPGPSPFALPVPCLRDPSTRLHLQPRKAAPEGPVGREVSRGGGASHKAGDFQELNIPGCATAHKPSRSIPHTKKGTGSPR